MCKTYIKKGEFRVISNESLNDSYALISVLDHESHPLPGQFYQLKPAENESRLLYTPISVYDYDKGILSFMIKIIGQKTKAISNLKIGQTLSYIGPLGNPFNVVSAKKVFLISGGIGYAPLKLLKRALKAENNLTTWLHGGRTSEDIFSADLTYTDDGSIGLKGFVTKDLNRHFEEISPDLVYCCGPKPMMERVYEYTKAAGIPSEFSLEEYMACGLGVCLGCAVSIKTNGTTAFKTVCKDGPVFKGEEIDWS